jgi:type II secretory pathway pseudopilin PulG
MPDESTVCPQCATPVQSVPPPPPPPQAGAPAPSASSAFLNPPVPGQYPPQAQYPPQGQQYRGQYQQPTTDGGAVTSLVLGITSFVLCLSFFTGIPAIIVGHISWSRIRRSAGRLKGEGMALAGLILGYCSLPFVLIVAAIAIPNLLRAKISANEAAAASTVRTINTSQITYSTRFPQHGYASDLATLGPGPGGSCQDDGTAEHACLLDNLIAASRCTAGQWCSKAGYSYNVSAVCDSARLCSNYVVTAHPIAFGSTGRKTFCATSDGVIRVRFGEFRAALTPEECEEWPPIT